MELRIFQKGFNYSQDGPGNRLVYHLQGCNLHCPWCANPEGLAVQGGTAYPVEALAEEVLRSRAMFFDGGGVTLTAARPRCNSTRRRSCFPGCTPRVCPPASRQTAALRACRSCSAFSVR